MANTIEKSTAARQVELLIRQLESLSTLPETATAFLVSANEKQPDITAVLDIIESDPALTAKIFDLAYEEGLTLSGEQPSVRQAVSKLPKQTIHDAVLSIKIFDTSSAAGTLPRKQLALHSIATACCADQIAKLVLPPEDHKWAYTAGLMHDIGKFAIAEVMPKSFERIAAEAEESAVSFASIEQKHLNLDHSIIGKRLAEKWHFPAEIAFAIWLHHSDTEALSDAMPAGKLAQVVRLADIITRQAGIGMSGSCDNPNSLPEILQSLNISHGQIEQIKHELHRKAEQKIRTLGLNNPGADTAYSQILRETADRLADANKSLSVKNRDMALNSAHMELINEFLLEVTPKMSSIEASERLAVSWKKHYQTGPVCVFLNDEPARGVLEVTTVSSGSEINTMLVMSPENGSVIPAGIQKKFAVLPAAEDSQWLFNQLSIDINPEKTFILPLIADSNPVGALLFEHRLPADPAEQSKSLSITADIAARIIAMAGASQKHQSLSEQFADLLGQLKTTRDKLAQSQAFAGVAEMAAGAAHELNNPLAVISGRIQLLMDIETDENKTQMLKQIQDRSQDISRIVEDLMVFARPTTPQPAKMTVDELIDAAIRQVQVDHNIRTIEMTRFGIDDLPRVNVDADQATNALKNIISNALEAYPEGDGAIIVTADCPQQQDSVTIQIIDSGCGMDSDTLAKAAEPFYSGKPAGRKPGMGLSHAKRLLELNKCQLNLTSKPDHGTTVTLTMPK